MLMIGRPPVSCETICRNSRRSRPAAIAEAVVLHVRWHRRKGRGRGAEAGAVEIDRRECRYRPGGTILEDFEVAGRQITDGSPVAIDDRDVELDQIDATAKGLFLAGRARWKQRGARLRRPRY